MSEDAEMQALEALFGPGAAPPKGDPIAEYLSALKENPSLTSQYLRTLSRLPRTCISLLKKPELVTSSSDGSTTNVSMILEFGCLLCENLRAHALYTAAGALVPLVLKLGKDMREDIRTVLSMSADHFIRLSTFLLRGLADALCEGVTEAHLTHYLQLFEYLLVDLPEREAKIQSECFVAYRQSLEELMVSSCYTLCQLFSLYSNPRYSALDDKIAPEASRLLVTVRQCLIRIFDGTKGCAHPPTVRDTYGRILQKLERSLVVFIFATPDFLKAIQPRAYDKGWTRIIEAFITGFFGGSQHEDRALRTLLGMCLQTCLRTPTPSVIRRFLHVLERLSQTGRGGKEYVRDSVYASLQRYKHAQHPVCRRNNLAILQAIFPVSDDPDVVALDLDFLKVSLSDPEPSVRRAAIEASSCILSRYYDGLCFSGRSILLGTLLELLLDSVPSVRMAAVKAVADLHRVPSLRETVSMAVYDNRERLSLLLLDTDGSRASSVQCAYIRLICSVAGIGNLVTDASRPKIGYRDLAFSMRLFFRGVFIQLLATPKQAIRTLFPLGLRAFVPQEECTEAQTLVNFLLKTTLIMGSASPLVLRQTVLYLAVEAKPVPNSISAVWELFGVVLRLTGTISTQLQENGAFDVLSPILQECISLLTYLHALLVSLQEACQNKLAGRRLIEFDSWVKRSGARTRELLENIIPLRTEGVSVLVKEGFLSILKGYGLDRESAQSITSLLAQLITEENSDKVGSKSILQLVLHTSEKAQPPAISLAEDTLCLRYCDISAHMPWEEGMVVTDLAIYGLEYLSRVHRVNGKAKQDALMAVLYLAKSLLRLSISSSNSEPPLKRCHDPSDGLIFSGLLACITLHHVEQYFKQTHLYDCACVLAVDIIIQALREKRERTMLTCILELLFLLARSTCRSEYLQDTIDEEARLLLQIPDTSEDPLPPRGIIRHLCNAISEASDDQMEVLRFITSLLDTNETSPESIEGFLRRTILLEGMRAYRLY
ncbi:hypothetical protein GMRT_13566 [Giardia muris]|uniref:Uncharacterized protein n=1 Tax=Giardia muris TaxID=5742 RepID=A0A4Z1SW62_GIAMU|nr:hypothetical protein GMRT_13566 [Giardia muris]|eukprot:TNJ29986.1 hypothetical protein GMRT_13566 [Giardia muris]